MSAVKNPTAAPPFQTRIKKKKKKNLKKTKKKKKTPIWFT